MHVTNSKRLRQILNLGTTASLKASSPLAFYLKKTKICLNDLK